MKWLFHDSYPALVYLWEKWMTIEDQNFFTYMSDIIEVCFIIFMEQNLCFIKKLLCLETIRNLFNILFHHKMAVNQ